MSRVGLDPNGSSVPTTNYAIPGSNVVYLAKTGSDSNDGLTWGTAKASLFGGSGAYSVVPDGGTIVVGEGVYEEGVTGGSSIPSKTKSCTIQADPDAQVWFDGSQVVDTFTGSGPWTKTGWTYNPGNTSGWSNSDRPQGAGRPVYYFDQVYIDGVRQQHVVSATPGANQFFIDHSGQFGTAGKIYLGTNPSGKEVRISRYRSLAVFDKPVHWKGIGFRRYSGGSTSSNTEISVTSGSPILYYGGTSAGTTIENCVFADSSFVAVMITKTGFTVNRCVFARTGKTHLEVGGTTGGDGFTLTNCIFDKTNQGGWPSEPTAGAVKIVKCDISVVANNLVTNFPYCYGIWYDIDCTRAVIAYNEVNGGPLSKTGILWEISGGGKFPLTGTSRTQYWSYIVGNVIKGTYSYASLCVLTCNFTKIWHNVIEGGITSCLMIRQDDRPKAGATANTYNIGAQSYPSNNIEVCNNNIGRASATVDAIVFAETVSNAYPDGHYPTLTGDEMISRFSGNWFQPNPGSGPTTVSWGTNGLSGRVNYRVIPATGGASALDSKANFVGADPDWKNFQQTTEPNLADRVPIPADVLTIMQTYGGMIDPGPDPEEPIAPGNYIMTRRESGVDVPYVLNRYEGGRWREQVIRRQGPPVA